MFTMHWYVRMVHNSYLGVASSCDWTEDGSLGGVAAAHQRGGRLPRQSQRVFANFSSMIPTVWGSELLGSDGPSHILYLCAVWYWP